MGGGFDAAIKNKTFVFRGDPLESIGSFSGRMQRRFPKAKRINPGKEKDEHFQSETGQFLQISSLKTAFTSAAKGSSKPYGGSIPLPDVLAEQEVGCFSRCYISHGVRTQNTN